MNNYRLKLQYDGTRYNGWQIQKNGTTVQGVVTNAINTILRVNDIKLTSSGRTDTGVHALDQPANFYSSKIDDLDKFLFSLNAVLPKDIACNAIDEVSPTFHARFDAVSRTYLFLFHHTKSPFWNNYSHLLYKIPEIKELNKISEAFIRKDDFSSFAKKIDPKINPVCKVSYARWLRISGKTLFIIEADRFLHGMVRTVTGTILDFYFQKRSLIELNEIFKLKDRSLAAKALPAKALFLFKVKYPDE